MDKARLRVIDIFSKNIFQGSLEMEKNNRDIFVAIHPSLKPSISILRVDCVYIFTLSEISQWVRRFKHGHGYLQPLYRWPKVLGNTLQDEIQRSWAHWWRGGPNVRIS